MKISHFICMVALATAVAACCSCRKGKKEGKPLTETTWATIEWEGQPFQSDDNYMLVFSKDENRFGGRGDCNSIMGTYTTAENGKIKLESVASTRAMCPNQTQEDKFIKTLDQIDSYRIDGDLLMLMKDGELLMVLQAKQPTLQ